MAGPGRGLRAARTTMRGPGRSLKVERTMMFGPGRSLRAARTTIARLRLVLTLQQRHNLIHRLLLFVHPPVHLAFKTLHC